MRYTNPRLLYFTSVTNPISWTCKNCWYKCAADCEHCHTIQCSSDNILSSTYTYRIGQIIKTLCVSQSVSEWVFHTKRVEHSTDRTLNIWNDVKDTMLDTMEVIHETINGLPIGTMTFDLGWIFFDKMPCIRYTLKPSPRLESRVWITTCYFSFCILLYLAATASNRGGLSTVAMFCLTGEKMSRDAESSILMVASLRRSRILIIKSSL